MTINKGNVANICVLWCFYLILGGPLSFSVPLVLIIVASVLYLIDGVKRTP